MSDLLKPINLEKLLEGRLFIVWNEQIIFFNETLKQYVITNISPNQKYTIHDYMKLPEGAPYQLIEGGLIFMPGPVDEHQKILGKLYLLIGNYVMENNLGEVRFAPLDVHLDTENIYQPDILFISLKRSSIIQKFIFGAPDFIIEVLSPSTEDKDRNEKKNNYGKFGVDEYWMVNLREENIEIYYNTLGIMHLKQTAGHGDKIVSKAIHGFELEIDKIFR